MAFKKQYQCEFCETDFWWTDDEVPDECPDDKLSKFGNYKDAFEYAVEHSQFKIYILSAQKISNDKDNFPLNTTKEPEKIKF